MRSGAGKRWCWKCLPSFVRMIKQLFSFRVSRRSLLEAWRRGGLEIWRLQSLDLGLWNCALRRSKQTHLVTIASCHIDQLAKRLCQKPCSCLSCVFRIDDHAQIRGLVQIDVHAPDLEGSEAEFEMTSTSFCFNWSSRSRFGKVRECEMRSTSFCFNWSSRSRLGKVREYAMRSTSACFNSSSRLRSGKVESRICDDVDKLCSKSMLFCQVFCFNWSSCSEFGKIGSRMCNGIDKLLLQMEFTLAIWKGRKENVRWRRQVFASIGAHACDLEGKKQNV